MAAPPACTFHRSGGTRSARSRPRTPRVCAPSCTSGRRAHRRGAGGPNRRGRGVRRPDAVAQRRHGWRRHGAGVAGGRQRRAPYRRCSARPWPAVFRRRRRRNLGRLVAGAGAPNPGARSRHLPSRRAAAHAARWAEPRRRVRRRHLNSGRDFRNRRPLAHRRESERRLGAGRRLSGRSLFLGSGGRQSAGQRHRRGTAETPHAGRTHATSTAPPPISPHRLLLTGEFRHEAKGSSLRTFTNWAARHWPDRRICILSVWTISTVSTCRRRPPTSVRHAVGVADGDAG